MKFSITLPVYNRPDSLKLTLESLYNNSISNNFDLVIGLEPGNNECKEICESIDKNKFNKVSIVYNNNNYGIMSNHFSLINYVFNDGYDFNLILEDDLYISKDSLYICKLYPHVINNTVCLCLLNAKNVTDTDFCGRENYFIKENEFTPCGVLLSLDQWKTYFKPNWFLSSDGWAKGIYSYIRDNGLLSYQSEYTRIKHLSPGINVNDEMQNTIYTKIPFYGGDVLDRYNFI